MGVGGVGRTNVFFGSTLLLLSSNLQATSNRPRKTLKSSPPSPAILSTSADYIALYNYPSTSAVESALKFVAL